MRVQGIFKIAVLACIAQSVMAGQNMGNENRPATRPKPAVTGIVTQKETEVVFERLQNAIYRVVLEKPAPAAAKKSNSTAPATKAQIIQQLNALFELARPEFKYTPNKVPTNQAPITLPKTSPARPTLEKLIAWGFIAKVSPLATGAKDTLTLAEFGDSVGYFLSRMSELTHTPSIKFSPELMGGDG